MSDKDWYLYAHVYVPYRLEAGLNPHGWVTRILPRRRYDEEVTFMIKFARPLMWARWANDPEFLLPGGDSDTLTLDEFHQYKVSSISDPFPDYRKENVLCEC